MRDKVGRADVGIGPYGGVTRGEAKRAVGDAGPYESVTRSADGRADVGSELSAASGRSSEVSEWPRSKFPASAVRQRRNFGHRNRIIGPYGGVTRGTAKRAVGDAGPYEISSFGIFPDENFLRQRDSVISRLFSSGLPSTMGETKEGIA